MSAPQRPLTGEQILQRIGAEATGRELITAADAEAARDAIEAQQQNDGLDFIASSNPTDPGFPPGSVPSSTYVLGTSGWQLTMALNDIQDKYLDDNSIWLGVAGVAEPFATGAKGRDLLAIADDAALQSEIVARLVSADLVDLGRVLIGVNSPKDGEAFNITSVGTKPTATFPDEILMGDGAAMFGAWVDAPSLRYGGTDILARANTWTAAQTIKGGSTPGTPAGDESRHGNGVGRYGRYVEAAHYRLSTAIVNDTGTIDNLEVEDIGVILFLGSGTLTVKGLDGGTPEGRKITIVAGLNMTVTLVNDSNDVITSNRMRTGSTDLVLNNQAVELTRANGRYWAHNA